MKSANFITRLNVVPKLLNKIHLFHHVMISGNLISQKGKELLKWNKVSFSFKGAFFYRLRKQKIKKH